MTTEAAAPLAQEPASTPSQVAGCPPHVLAAIYGAKPPAEQKQKTYEASLQRCAKDDAMEDASMVRPGRQTVNGATSKANCQVAFWHLTTVQQRAFI